jgi:hypothetical protein
MFVCACLLVCSAVSPKKAEADGEGALYNLIFNLQTTFGISVLNDDELNIMEKVQGASTRRRTQTVNGCFAVFEKLANYVQTNGQYLLQFAMLAGASNELMARLVDGVKTGVTMSRKRFVKIAFHALEKDWEDVDVQVYDDDTSFCYK